MRLGWQSRNERALRGATISAQKKLEGIRLLNELADMVLTKHQKAARRKLKKINA